MMKTLTAVHVNEGTWEFTCPLHDEPEIWYAPASENYARSLLKIHMDNNHPSIKVRFYFKDKHVVHTTYTGITTIDTGDLL